MRKLRIIGISIGLAGLALLVWAADPAMVAAALGKVPTGHILAVALLVQIQIVLSALRWRFTAGRLGQDFPVRIAIREYYLGSVLNQTLPGGIAGDATRVYRVQDDTSGGWKRAAMAVVLERLSGQFAFFVLTGIGLLAWPFVLPVPLDGISGPVLWGALLSSIALIVAALRFRQVLAAWFQRLRPSLAAAFWSRGAFAVQVSLSALIVGCYVVSFLLASDAVGAPLPAVAAITIIPLCLLAMLVPLGFGGWGPREATAAALWPLVGFTGAEGIAASLVYGSLTLAGTALPGLCVAFGLLLRRLGRQF
ncbi:lysylphosphatidylglycerol synthase transmembrane domain-containing protein [Pannonibacter carbonis]|uniref:lysylphosphatidylglycerol synthase transmembrane domain-containing protein n=1 Tax=Pannonibacter carbonis TaxID=2067569 RepID=UPI000D0FE288|nr:lysylphosphatidylglycerol synthase transmembrane domain-containing protein [Pannonibacter carbonis]